MSYFHDIQTWIEIASSIIGGLVHLSFLTNSIMLFACAYNMRGLLVGFAFLLHASSLLLGISITVNLGDKCYNYIIFSSVMVAITDSSCTASWLAGTRGELETSNTMYTEWWRRSTIDTFPTTCITEHLTTCLIYYMIL